MIPTALILFDIDGTLVRSAGAGRIALSRAFRAVFGVDGFDRATRHVRFDGSTDPRILADLAAAAGLPAERFAAERERIETAYYHALAREMSQPHPEREVLPGVRPLLEVLDRRPGVRLGLLTGNFERSARLKLDPFGLNPFFPHGGFGSDHEDRSEMARIARDRIERALGVQFETDRVVVVGDTERDVKCARDNGFRSVAVATGWTSPEHLAEAGPDVLLSDLSDLDAALSALELAPSETQGSPTTSTE